MSSPSMSLRDRLKQYQTLKESNSNRDFKPGNREDELNDIALNSPMQRSKRSFQSESETSESWAGPPTTPRMDDDNRPPSERDSWVPASLSSQSGQTGPSDGYDGTTAEQDESIIEEEYDDDEVEEVVYEDEHGNEIYEEEEYPFESSATSLGRDEEESFQPTETSASADASNFQSVTEESEEDPEALAAAAAFGDDDGFHEESVVSSSVQTTETPDTSGDAEMAAALAAAEEENEEFANFGSALGDENPEEGTEEDSEDQDGFGAAAAVGAGQFDDDNIEEGSEFDDEDADGSAEEEIVYGGSADVESGTRGMAMSKESPAEREAESKRFKFLAFLLVLVGLLAIAAIVVPLLLNKCDCPDINTSSRSVTSAPTAKSPAPTAAPVLPPTEVVGAQSTPVPTPVQTPSPTEPGATRSPTAAPSASPTVVDSMAPTITPNSAQLNQLLQALLFSVSGEEVFEDRSSPQYQAARFLADEDDFRPLTSVNQAVDRYSAMVLYYAMNGDGWLSCSSSDTTCGTARRRGLQRQARGDGPWLTGDHCGWAFIQCTDEGFIDNILFQSNNGLTGELPREMYAFPLLRQFAIIDNPVSGSLPSEWAESSTTLVDLVFRNTSMSGSIPDGAFSNAPTANLIIQDNDFSGELSNFGNHTTLLRLFAAGNSFSSIPDFSSYSELFILDMAGNGMGGPIPATLAEATNLEVVLLNDNMLTGRVPEALANLPFLSQLKLENNNLSEMVPDALCTKGLFELTADCDVCEVPDCCTACT